MYAVRRIMGLLSVEKQGALSFTPRTKNLISFYYCALMPGQLYSNRHDKAAINVAQCFSIWKHFKSLRTDYERENYHNLPSP